MASHAESPELYVSAAHGSKASLGGMGLQEPWERALGTVKGVV